LNTLVTFLEKHPPTTRLIAISDEIESLVQQTTSLVTLEKTPLISIELIPDNNQLVKHIQCCGRKMPFHSTIKQTLTVFKRIQAEYGARSIKANLAGGVDFKALSHAVRVNNQAKELLTTKHIAFPRPDAELLKNIKTGQIPYDEVATIIETGVAELHDIHQKSTLPEQGDSEFVKDFIYYQYKKVVCES
jgi:hypothetical protein